MDEKTLFKIAIISALAGILIILFLAENIGPTQLSIGNITKEHLEQTIQTSGRITSSKETTGLYIINLKDSTGELPAIIFKDENITISRYLPVKVIAKVIEYENELELQIEQMTVLNLTEGNNINEKNESIGYNFPEKQKTTSILKIATLSILLMSIISIIIFLLTIKKGKK